MIVFNIFLHTTHKHRVEAVRKYWAKTTGFSVSLFDIIYWKKNKINETKRRNTGENYNGVLKIKVRRSSGLVRKIAGWSQGIFVKVIYK